MRREFHKEDIKAMIRKRGMTLRSLSLQENLQKETVARSLSKPIPRANRAIAKLLGLKLNELWPDWYDKSGNRKFKRNGGNNSRKRGRRHGQKAF